MPFDESMDDLFVLGIRDVAEQLGLVAERADEVLHTGSIVSIIQERIDQAAVIVAETSVPNPNVYYELGYAHGRSKPVIMLARAGSDLPFDVRGINHILYSSITDLRGKLPQYLRLYTWTDVVGPSTYPDGRAHRGASGI